MKVTKLVQSTILIETGTTTVLVDPGKYNLSRGIDTSSFNRLDALVITHEHEDHFDEGWTTELIERWAPTVVTNRDIAGVLAHGGVGAKVVRPGEHVALGDVELRAAYADHFVKGKQVANFGLILEADGATIYHTSDTFVLDPSDPTLERAVGADLMLEPISNRGLVMGIDDALFMASRFQPKVLVPMHYDSPKDAKRVRPEDFCRRADELRDSLDGLATIDVRVLGFRESMELTGVGA